MTVEVSRIIESCEGDRPFWRVVTSEGITVMFQAASQRELLHTLDVLFPNQAFIASALAEALHGLPL